MKILNTPASLAGLLFLTTLLSAACSPMRNLTSPPNTWNGDSNLKSTTSSNNVAKKNVFIIADAKMTVLFDMLAPFYLFNETEKANVYIIAEDNTPILIKRGLFVRPQLTFHEADSMGLTADVIVIPALSKRDEHQDIIIIKWITAHFSDHTKIMAVCDGASTAAATGLYDGVPLTCHASDYAGLKLHFSKPVWMNNVAVTKSGNLFSTAGVSNAVEGSLTVINELFGRETMLKVLENINYPESEIKAVHESIEVNGKSKFTVAKKIIFRKNKNIALQIEDGINEFEMASIIETYGRTFPASFTVFNRDSSTVVTKYGLTLIANGAHPPKKFDELHLLAPGSLSKEEELYYKNTKIIRYDNPQKQYPINACLIRIEQQYGHQFMKFVKVSLDYN